MPGKEDHTERILGVLLRAGAMAAAAVVLAGGIWYMAKFGTLPPHYRTFRGEPQDLRSVAGIWHGVLHVQPRSLIQLGLLLLREILSGYLAPDNTSGNHDEEQFHLVARILSVSAAARSRAMCR